MTKWILVILGVALAAGVAVWVVLTQFPIGNPVAEGPTEEAVAIVDEVPLDEVSELGEPIQTGTAEAADEIVVPLAPVPLVAVDGVISAGEYAHVTEIVDVEVHWSNDAQTLRVGLVSPGTGFVAIGFDPSDRMLGANVIIGSVAEGVLTIRDDYGNAALSHDADTRLGGVDNIVSAAGHQWADQTVIEFIIPLDSGDPTDKALVPGGTYPIIVSYHGLEDDFATRHSRRGSGEMSLDSGSGP